MAAAADLGSVALNGRVGSNPTPGTKQERNTSMTYNEAMNRLMVSHDPEERAKAFEFLMNSIIRGVKLFPGSDHKNNPDHDPPGMPDDLRSRYDKRIVELENKVGELLRSQAKLRGENINLAKQYEEFAVSRGKLSARIMELTSIIEGVREWAEMEFVECERESEHSFDKGWYSCTHSKMKDLLSRLPKKEGK